MQLFGQKGKVYRASPPLHGRSFSTVREAVLYRLNRRSIHAACVAPRDHSHASVFPPLVAAMFCFRIDLSTYVDMNEAKLEAWANNFFVHHTWKKQLLFGEVVEPDYTVQKLQTSVNNILKNWGARSAKRCRTQWVNRISPWDFAQECRPRRSWPLTSSGAWLQFFRRRSSACEP